MTAFANVANTSVGEPLEETVTVPEPLAVVPVTVATLGTQYPTLTRVKTLSTIASSIAIPIVMPAVVAFMATPGWLSLKASRSPTLIAPFSAETFTMACPEKAIEVETLSEVAGVAVTMPAT
ncbi:MAG: hypothetical protein UU70_C0019G0007 [Candidatus Yanofskybacteria bacterium GW2011_GWA1_41_6]|uniref:Uncharacterized protein n=1 Tax=Candidatus Yanofskybacteria bacterium GW2011_GWA1_41_6 TaxID=1619020 RepID=A0A0G0ZK10_9BACT|nr:MAG: hypothetical protein UU70_C0019G0007 [Candidatus Yanofskybacteria bacterium GW2011_GWA1_41_6]